MPVEGMVAVVGLVRAILGGECVVIEVNSLGGVALLVS
mgnify:CR=1 FL=1